MSANTRSCPWYDKCGFALKKGCSVCPSGYANDGCTCRRNPNAIYPTCKAGYRGVGPMCWPKA